MKAEDEEKLKKLKQLKQSKTKDIQFQFIKSSEELFDESSRQDKYHDELLVALKDLGEALQVNVEPPDLDPLLKKLDSVEILKDQLKSLDQLSIKVASSLGKEVRIEGFRDLWEMIVRQNNKIDKANREKQDEFIAKSANLTTYLNKLTETVKQGQEPTDFKPMRIVVGGDGVPLKYLTQFPSSRGGGGSSSGGGDASAANQTSGVQKTQLVDAGGEAATITGGKLDVNASVDTTGLATSAIQTDKSQFTKLTDGTDTGLITASGEQNVLETNSVAIAASVSVLDDWDESDRAKVNPIAGQVGVQGGSGTTNALTQRVVLATDVALPTGTNLVGDVGIQPRTSGGLNTFMASGSDGSTALTNTAQAVKASAGQVFGYYAYNPNATAQFIHFYNTAAGSVTVGTTNPLFTLTIPALAGANLMNPLGILFTNAGFSVAATATAGGNGAPGVALDLVVWFA